MYFNISHVFLVAVILIHLLLGRGVMRYALWMMRPIAIFVAIILGFHIVTGDTISGLVIVLRMIILVALANLVTMTTKLDDMIAVVVPKFRCSCGSSDLSSLWR